MTIAIIQGVVCTIFFITGFLLSRRFASSDASLSNGPEHFAIPKPQKMWPSKKITKKTPKSISEQELWQREQNQSPIDPRDRSHDME